MYLALTDAPLGTPLTVARFSAPDLARRLGRMGLFEGSELVRLEQEVTLRSVRVRGGAGEVILGGGMALKMVVHLNDGRKLPLSEMQPGESGHLEGLTGGQGLSNTLSVLGLKIDDPVVLVRNLPPMDYQVLTETGARTRLPEGMAAKIWGQMEGRSLQFASARAGAEFITEKILGGYQAREMLREQGIEPGKRLTLEGVAPAQSLRLAARNPVAISTRQGLRLFLEPRDASQIFVRPGKG